MEQRFGDHHCIFIAQREPEARCWRQTNAQMENDKNLPVIMFYFWLEHLHCLLKFKDPRPFKSPSPSPGRLSSSLKGSRALPVYALQSSRYCALIFCNWASSSAVLPANVIKLVFCACNVATIAEKCQISTEISLNTSG